MQIGFPITPEFYPLFSKTKRIHQQNEGTSCNTSEQTFVHMRQGPDPRMILEEEGHLIELGFACSFAFCHPMLALSLLPRVQVVIIFNT